LISADDASAPSPDPAVKDALLTANLIICATSSTVPLFPSSWVSDGTHVVLIGSYKHTMHEIDETLVRRALPSNAGARSALLVDSRSACLAEAGELISAGIEGNQLVEIGELVSFTAEGEVLFDAALQLPAVESRGTTGPVTIFKSVGVGLRTSLFQILLCSAECAYRRRGHRLRCGAKGRRARRNRTLRRLGLILGL
jgi:ornithine cyclodeaminase